MPSALFCALMSPIAICISMAQASAASMSPSRTTGAPNSAMIESPMNLSMVPP